MVERVWNGGSRRMGAPGGLVISASLKVWARFSRMFGMAGCHVAENGGRQLLPDLTTRSHVKLFVCSGGEFHNCLAGEFIPEIASLKISIH